MANLEHLKILEQGVSVWNEWRNEEKNYYLFPDLQGVNISKAILKQINFAFTSLTDANVSEANLSRAYMAFGFMDNANFGKALLHRTNFRESDLRGASFIGADLNGAYFGDSNLVEADFSGARLFGARFIDAKLHGANFKGAKLNGTIFSRSNLSRVKGLNSSEHLGPSIIDTTTLALSGLLPIKFLRGCGVPDIFIEYLPSLVDEPIQFYSCFISYSSKNQPFVDRLYSELQDRGVRCWLASEDLKIGEKIRIRIDESIRLHDKLLLVLSRHSVASDWVEQEVETALDRERREKRTVLFPIRLDDTVMRIDTGWPALIKNSRNIGDFRKWKNPEAYQKAFNKLLGDLKAGE